MLTNFTFHGVQVTVDSTGNLKGLPKEWLDQLGDSVEEDKENGIENATEIKNDVVNFYKEWQIKLL